MKISLFYKGEKLSLIEYLEKHAILFTFAICVFFSGFCFMRQESLDPGNLYLCQGMLMLAFFASAVFAHKKFQIKSQFCAVGFVAFSILSYLWLCGLHKTEFRAFYLFITLLLLTLSVFVLLLVRKKMSVEKSVIFVFILGFLLRITYVLVVSVEKYQHDFYGFFDQEFLNDKTNYEGHGAYISYLFYNNLKLPDFNPMAVNQFYHPPFHYFLCALWLKIQTLLGIEITYAQENIQMLTLFYSSTCMILAYKTLKELGIKGIGLLIGFSIFAAHPTFIIFSGSINNDILSVTLMLSALYMAIKWYKSEKISHIIMCALAIGFAMMTKLSAYMICLPIAIIFIIKFFKDIVVSGGKSLKRLVIQFSLFLLVCAPIALFWPLRNFILYKMPLNYVQRLTSDDDWQYIGNYTIAQRIFLFKPSEFIGSYSVYDQWTDRGAMLYNEFNPLVSLLKTSMFGEYINDYELPQLKFFGDVLFFTSVLLAILPLVCCGFVLYMSIKKRKEFTLKVSLFALYISMILFYYIFCFTYPHHCTMNIRYISPTILVGAIFIAMGYEELQLIENPKFVEAKKIINISLITVVSIFVIFSTIFVALLAK